jgi:hypothetical protein
VIKNVMPTGKGSDDASADDPVNMFVGMSFCSHKLTVQVKNIYCVANKQAPRKTKGYLRNSSTLYPGIDCYLPSQISSCLINKKTPDTLAHINKSTRNAFIY